MANCPNCGAGIQEGYYESGGLLEPREGACARCGFHAVGSWVIEEGKDMEAEQANREVADD